MHVHGSVSEGTEPQSIMEGEHEEQYRGVGQRGQGCAPLKEQVRCMSGQDDSTSQCAGRTDREMDTQTVGSG